MTILRAGTVATRQELRADFARMEAAHQALAPVPCDHRIAYHDETQEAVKVMTPAPRFIAALMAGGFVRRVRCIGDDPVSGAPVLEGSGELMGPMSYDEAVAFVAWKDMPPGTNHFQILHTDDLPRIGGSIDKARKFRAAWRLKEAT
ncbi:hypothetical protein FG93_01083 [Bosea sp. LC85]|uniref:hypothetical protein n=1 Tax=Bosea sp. LC85 TaxID=1502851 RepID=UPI0004E2F5C9|nr:hypothetical protein [Bosea sp. LC85]KFC74497.1 hypothetical protein FG93_01083 [Bosea sp. LC85]